MNRILRGVLSSRRFHPSVKGNELGEPNAPSKPRKAASTTEVAFCVSRLAQTRDEGRGATRASIHLSVEFLHHLQHYVLRFQPMSTLQRFHTVSDSRRRYGASAFLVQVETPRRYGDSSRESPDFETELSPRKGSAI